jgi:hypothetical protein
LRQQEERIQPEGKEVSWEIDMTDKEMKRLSRAELLELLLIQTKETEFLEKKLEEAEAKLTDRQLQIEKAGDLAHAALAINGVMEAAQAAAQQYLDNVMRMDREAAKRGEGILSNARQEIETSRQEVEQAWQEIEKARQEVEAARQKNVSFSVGETEKTDETDSDQDWISEIYTLLNGDLDI